MGTEFQNEAHINDTNAIEQHNEIESVPAHNVQPITENESIQIKEEQTEKHKEPSENEILSISLNKDQITQHTDMDRMKSLTPKQSETDDIEENVSSAISEPKPIKNESSSPPQTHTQP